MWKWVRRLGAIGVVAALLAAPARATSWDRENNHAQLAGSSQEMTTVSVLGNELRRTELPEPVTMVIIGATLLAAFRSRRQA